MPILNIKMLPMIRINNMTVVKPSTALPKNLSNNALPPAITLRTNVMAPSSVTICRGKEVKEVIDEMAYLKRLIAFHEELGLVDSGTSKGIFFVG